MSSISNLSTFHISDSTKKYNEYLSRPSDFDVSNLIETDEEIEEWANSEVGFVGGVVHSTAGTIVRNAFRSKEGYLFNESDWIPDEESKKKVYDAVGGDKVAYRAIIRGCASKEDLDGRIKTVQENLEYARISARAGLFDNLASGIGDAVGDPVNWAMGLTTAGLASIGRITISEVGTLARIGAGAVGNVVSGQVGESFTGVETSMAMDAATGVLFGTAFEAALPSGSKYLKDTFRRARIIQYHQKKGLSLDPSFFKNIGGSNTLAVASNKLREGLDKILPDVTLNSVFTKALENTAPDSRLKELISKSLKMEQGIRVLNEDGTYTHVSVLSPRKTAEERLRDSEDQIFAWQNTVAEPVERLRTLGFSDKEIDRAVYNALAGDGQKIPKAMAKEISDIVNVTKPMLEERGFALVKRGMLNKLFKDYVPLNIDHKKRDDFINKQKGANFQEKRANAIKMVRDALSKTLEDPEGYKRLREHFREELKEDYEAYKQAVKESEADIAAKTKELAKKAESDSKLLNKELNDRLKAEARIKKAKEDPILKQAEAEARDYLKTKKDLAKQLAKDLNANAKKTLKDKETVYKEWDKVEKAFYSETESVIRDAKKKHETFLKESREKRDAQIKDAEGIFERKKAEARDTKKSTRAEKLKVLEETRDRKIDRANKAHKSRSAKDLKEVRRVRDNKVRSLANKYSKATDRFNKNLKNIKVDGFVKRNNLTNKHRDALKALDKRRVNSENRFKKAVDNLEDSYGKLLTRLLESAVRKDDKIQARLAERVQRFRDKGLDPNKTLDDFDTDEAFEAWVNKELDNASLGYIDGNQSKKELLLEEHSSSANYRKQRIPWKTDAEIDGFRVDDLRESFMDSIPYYQRKSAGDLIVHDTYGTTSYDETNRLFNDVVTEEINTTQHPEKIKNLERGMKQMLDRIYGVSSKTYDENLEWGRALGEILRNFTFAKANTYMGLLNHTEVAGSLQAYGASMFLKQIPKLGDKFNDWSNGKISLEDRRLINDILFGFEVKQMNIFSDIRRVNRKRFSNQMLADIVSGTEYVANALPTTKYLNASQASIVSAVQGAMLSEAIHKAYKMDTGYKGMLNAKAMRRNSFSDAKIHRMYSALREAFELHPDGSITVKNLDALTTNVEALNTIRRLGDYAADESILRTGLADNFLWADSQNELLNLLMQFKTFAVRSYNKRFVKALNRIEDGDGYVEAQTQMISLALATIGNVGITSIRSAGMSGEDREKYLERTLGVKSLTEVPLNSPSIVMSSILRTSAMAAPALVLNFMGVGTSAKTTSDTTRGSDGGLFTPHLGSGDILNMFPAASSAMNLFNLGVDVKNYFGVNAMSDDNVTPEDRFRASNNLWKSAKRNLPNWSALTNAPMYAIKPDKDNY